MAEFFKYENQRELPSVADRSSLRSGTISDVLGCMMIFHGRPDQAKLATVVLLDMAAVVHMVRPTSANTSSEYVSKNMVPFLEAQLTPTF